MQLLYGKTSLSAITTHTWQETYIKEKGNFTNPVYLPPCELLEQLIPSKRKVKYFSVIPCCFVRK